MIPQETIDRINDTVQIVDVVGDFVNLKRRGANYVACCPFHNEKTPSFYVSPAKGIYKCFGCGKSGTAVRFVMEHEGVGYADALRYLARKYHIEIVEKEETAEEIALRQRTESLYLVSEFAAKFFQENLATPVGKAVGLTYFHSRGLEDETIRKWGLGWAPKERNVLHDKAIAAGYKEEYLEAAGLCMRRDDGTMNDRFFERVIFPIHSVSGRVIAFGGRTLQSGHPTMKYVNTPTTEIYVKERSLYGIYFAKGEITRQEKCYLVEGYLDVLSMHQLGITNVVASSGTSLTIQQIRLIHKFTQNVTIMYDGDSAGIHAALRGISLVLQEGLNVKIVLLPDGDDPDSFARRHTLDEVKDFIRENERDFIAFKTDLLLEEAAGDPIKRAELINDIADTIAMIPDAIKRSVYVQDSAQRFGIDEGILYSRITSTREKMLQDARKSGGPRNPDRQPAGESPVPESPAETPVETPVETEQAGPVLENRLLAPAEEDLLWFLLNQGLMTLVFESDSEFYDPNQTDSVADFIRDNLESDHLTFCNSIYKKLYDSFFDLYDNRTDLGQDALVLRLMNGPDQQMADLVAKLTQQKYPLSVKNFMDSMTNPSTAAAMFVPRAILVYKAKRVQARQLELTEQLRRQPEDAMDILAQMQRMNHLRKELEGRLGRIR